MSSNERTEQALILEEAKRRMQEDLAKVHIRGRLTSYFEGANGNFLVATASYALGNLEEALKNSKVEGNLTTLTARAIEACKELHFFSRFMPPLVEEENGKIRNLLEGRNMLPGDPPIQQ